MDRLKKIGDVKAFASKDVKFSRVGIGFEKLDRDVFDPENAYDPVAALGVKWVRIQSGDILPCEYCSLHSSCGS